jgi:hypothetical protein
MSVKSKILIFPKLPTIIPRAKQGLLNKITGLLQSLDALLIHRQLHYES